jgi:outer membrane protein assembly factor BamB
MRLTGWVWLSCTVAGLQVAAGTSAADWPQFLGPSGAGVSDETGQPTMWDGPGGTNIRWKVELPGRGVSSPVVVRGKVYVRACTGVRQDRLHVLCLDAATGKRLWERQFAATGNTHYHPKTCAAAPTPAADGERVFALFASGDLAALSADGDLLWYRSLARDYPHVANQVGMAASPVVCGDVVLVPMENADDSFAAGLDRLTGRNRWKVPRPRDINWVTPRLVDRGGHIQAIFLSANDLTAYDLATGRECWRYREEGLSPNPSVPTPAVGGGLIVTGNGVALRLRDRGEPVPAWRSSKVRPAYASPLYYRGRLYAVSNTGTRLDCFDMEGGKALWQERVRGPFSASPVAADGNVYFVNEDGVTTVVEVGDRPRVLATNPLGEGVLATPAISGKALFLRSDRHLFCIGEGPSPATRPQPRRE